MALYGFLKACQYFKSVMLYSQYVCDKLKIDEFKRIWVFHEKNFFVNLKKKNFLLNFNQITLTSKNL